MDERLYAPPRDRVLVATSDRRVHALADRLWERASDAPEEPIRVAVEVFDGPVPGPLPERLVSWSLAPAAYEVTIGPLLATRVDLVASRVESRVSASLLQEEPALAARFVLEAPCAVLLARRAFDVLHAGAVVGPEGAVLVRGASGAGKSTLVAAAWQAGLGVLADESLLVARDDPDELAASVRDLTLLPDSVALLGILDSEPAYSGNEAKRRVPLFPGSSPSDRRARRVATFLLGPRVPGPARLVPLSPDEFAAEFAKGVIPEERVTSGRAAAGLDSAGRSGFRLDGASDLAGAVELIQMHAGRAVSRRRGRRS